MKKKDRWLNHVVAALETYNNHVLGTTLLTPFDMSIINKPDRST